MNGAMNLARPIVLALVIAALPVTLPSAGAPQAAGPGSTTTPIQHLIVVIGENRSFDHIFAAYAPPHGQTIRNLLSEGVIKADGSPGPNFARAAQYQAEVTTTFELAPARKTRYTVLPPAMTGNAPQAASDQQGPPFQTMQTAARLDRGLLPFDLRLLLVGATGLPRMSIDTRLPSATALPNGPFRLTPGVPYQAYTADPVHRFFQMWQQMDCSVRHATAANPSGCLADLFPWVEVTIGRGSDGKPQPAGFDERTTGEGSTAMGFIDMQTGDAPYFRDLAQRFTLNDNYHQPVMGGTGANHFMLTGDMVWYSDGNGNAAVPPRDQIENPNPQPGTNNYYIQDGYAGGSYVACADPSQPGVQPIVAYLRSLPAHPAANCETGHYYLVNNYAPGYLGDGTVNTGSRFVVPPSSVRTIGDALLERRITFRYYGEGWNAYIQSPGDFARHRYCAICNFLQYTPTIMTNPALRAEHVGDLDDFFSDVRGGALPAVVFVKPSSLNDGHPTTSKLDLLEAFVRRIVGEVRRQPGIWAGTAILVTFDEGGGFYDSGYVQPIDFFGDGTRVPLIVISPFSTGGRVVHTYTDHVSILKFIEKNWRLSPLTHRSRDNLPNPATAPSNPYVPTNGPAIGDLVDMFQFHPEAGTP
jgi:phospholipase C